MSKIKVRRTLKRDAGGYLDENEMADVVENLLYDCPDGEATYAELREKVPQVVRLTRKDLRKSKSRHGERMWEQILRNLGAHKENHEQFETVPGKGLRLKVAKRKKVAA